MSAAVWVNGGVKNPDLQLKYPLEKVELLSLLELKLLYEELLERTPPVRCGSDFLKSNILWVMQAKAANTCPKQLRKLLLKLSKKAKSNGSNNIKQGARLVREWHGDTYEVTVLDKGYVWQDKTYKSLTQIAGEITGTHLSGPKFFGLTKRR